MGEFSDFLAIERQNIERILNSLDELLREPLENSEHHVSLQSLYLHNFYNAIENILKRIIYEKGYNIVQSGSWHKDLIETAISKNVISAELGNDLRKFLTFRHFFVHSYAFLLNKNLVLELVLETRKVWNDFIQCVE